MKNIRKNIARVIIAAATVLCVGATSVSAGTAGLFTGLGITSYAADGISYIGATGKSKLCTDYTYLTEDTTKLTGGWYIVKGNVYIDGRLKVTNDSYIILTNNSTLTVEGGIEVASDCKFNVYTDYGTKAKLFAGTTNGTDTTAGTNKCGIGGPGAKVNIVGGNVYARGGAGSYGMQGEEIHLYWTNTTDSIFSNAYKGTVAVYSAFVNKSNGAAYYSSTVSETSLNGVTLRAATPVTSKTYNMDNGIYAVFNKVTVPNRIAVSGDAELYLSSNSTLIAEEGITVGSGDSLNIYGKSGKLYAGTTNGNNFLTDDNCAGIGSANGARAGQIIINNGTVYANGGRNAAGIGGSTADIRILGGTVTANGGSNAAGIGSGYNDKGADVSILGGTVKAYGGSNGTGIGSGYASTRSEIRLGTSSYNDSIYASSYSGIISFGNTLYTSDGQVANSGNIGGKTLTSQVTAYTVTLESNGGTTYNPVSVKANGYLSSLPTPTRRGYTFGGWYTDRNLRYEFDYRNTRITQNLTLYAKWVDSTHTVSFVTNGGPRINAVQVEDGAYLQEFQDPTRAGYTFGGWYTDANFRYRFNFRSTRIYEDLTLYAYWTSSNITVTFEAGNGAFSDGSTRKVVTMDAGESALRYAPSVPNFVSNGSEFAFDGWYIDTITGTPYYGEPLSANTKLVASYEWVRDIPASHTVNFYVDNQYVESQTVEDGDYLSVTRYITAYDWYTRTGNAFDLYTPIYQNYDLFATTSEPTPTYTVSIYINGSEAGSQTVEEGGTITMYSAYYTYEWTDENGNNIDPSSTYIYGNRTFHAITPGINPPAVGSTFSGGSLIAIIAGGLVLAGGGVAAGIAIGKKKK